MAGDGQRRVAAQQAGGVGLNLLDGLGGRVGPIHDAERGGPGFGDMLELDHGGLVLELRAGTTDRLPVAAAGGMIDLDGKHEVRIKVPCAELVKRYAKQVLVGFIKRLGRNLADIRLPVAREQGGPVVILEKLPEHVRVAERDLDMLQFVKGGTCRWSSL